MKFKKKNKVKKIDDILFFLKEMEGDIGAVIYRYVFTHYDEFKRGVSLASINIPNITASDIIEHIDHICKSYQKTRAKKSKHKRVYHLHNQITRGYPRFL